MPGTMTVGGGISDLTLRGGGIEPYAEVRFFDSETGGTQYTSAAQRNTPGAGGVVTSDAEAWIEPVDMQYPADHPGGAWAECPKAWAQRRWMPAHGIIPAGTGGGGGGGGGTGEADQLTVRVVTVGDHIELPGGWVRWNASGILEKSTNRGGTWSPVDTDTVYTGGGGGGAQVSDKTVVAVWHSEGSAWTQRPADLAGYRILYINPATGATAPSWLSATDLFLTKVTV